MSKDYSGSGRAVAPHGNRPFAGALARGIAMLLLGFLALANTAHADSPHLAYAARIAGDDSRTRVVMEFERKPDYAIHYLAGPPRIVVDLPETVFSFDRKNLDPRGVFSGIRYGAMAPGRSRIVLEAKAPVRLDLADLRKNEEGLGYRLVMDAAVVSQDEFAKVLSSQVWPEHRTTTGAIRGDRPGSTRPTEARPFTVVIDPGHGGIDTGATGVSGSIEKDLTLAFGKDLKTALEDIGKIRVVLTRDEDRFLSLGERVRIARQHEADLFISLHADSIRLHRIRGATVYTLSDRASDRMAEELAQRENESDTIAGVAIDDGHPEIADILLDLTRRETQAFSVGLARRIVSSFDGNIKLIKNPHRHAGFRVLQAPDVPSVLVEMGYLSNAEDEKLMRDEAWRRKVTELLAGSIDKYRTTVVAGRK